MRKASSYIESNASFFSRFEYKCEAGEIKRILGTFIYNSSPYNFSLSRQKSANFILRGTVSAIDSVGNVIKTKVKQKSDIPLVDETIPDKYKYLSRSVRCFSANEDDIKAAIADAVIKLYSVNAKTIEAERSVSLRPDTITAAMAAQTAAKGFVAQAHGDASGKSQLNAVKRLQNVCAKLPNKAMQDIRKTELTKWMDELSIPRDMRKELHEFWEYCRLKRICNGGNPVTVPARKKTSDATLIKRASRITELLYDQETELLDLIEAKCSGPLVGIALMLAGFTVKFISELKWESVVFYDKYDFVVVKFFQLERAGATHNYSRPVPPRVAVILQKRYAFLSGKYGEKVLSKMPVASYSENYKRPITASLLTKTAMNILLNSFMTYADYKLLTNENLDVSAASRVLFNTYKRDLESICNLEDDPGSLNFLLGLSLQDDITSDAYRDFTSVEGLTHLYDLLHVLCKEEPIEPIPDKVAEDGLITKTFTPKTTRSCCQVLATVILQPGQKLSIKVLHGVSGSFDARAITDTGRRKKVSEQIAITIPDA